MTKHTPGPWRVASASADGLLTDVIADNKRKGAFYVAQCNTEPDAALIAAAPQLLQALEAIASVADFGESDNSMELGDALIDVERKARAAIALANLEVQS
jgi:hypothetical protein